MKKHDEDLSVATEWYRKGMHDMEHGKKFTPPDNRLHARAYVTGWGDWIMGEDTTPEDLKLIIFG